MAIDYRSLFASNDFTRSQVDTLVRLFKLTLPDTYQTASEAAMLALPAKKGDICVRSDVTKSYALAAEPATTLANWVQIL